MLAARFAAGTARRFATGRSDSLLDWPIAHWPVPYRPIPYRPIPYRPIPYWPIAYWPIAYWSIPYWTIPYRTLGHRAARHWAARHWAGCDGLLGCAQHADQRFLLDRHFNFLRVVRIFDFFAGLTAR